MTTVKKDMTNAEYHSTLAIGSSGLKLLNRSPAHYYAHCIDPKRPAREQTPAQLLGSAVHMAILEPHIFDDTYIVLPDGIDRRTKDGKALYAEIIETGKTPIAEAMWIKIRDMVASASKHPLTQKLQIIALAEYSLFWLDSQTSSHCKIRPDWHVPPCDEYPNGLIVDVKTCGDASKVGFGKNAWNSDMHLQAALYSLGFHSHYGCIPEFKWLAIEADIPYSCAYYNCPTILFEYGTEEVNRLLKLNAECIKNNRWPSYDEDTTDLDLPNYAMRKIEGIEETEVSYV